jgi:hypothetical protein
VQQLKYTEEEWCIEWTWHTEHKRHKNRKYKECLQEDSEARKAGQCSRIVMRLVTIDEHYITVISFSRKD